METIDIRSLPIQPGDKVLDLGCGEGRHAIALNYHFPEATIVAIDLSHKDLNTAQTKHHTFSGIENTKTLYVQTNAYILPFNDAVFDHVICSEVLEHLHKYEDAINEMQRTLKAGGTLSISVPRAWPEKICWWLSHEYHNVEGGHIHIFNSKRLKNHIRAHQFNYIRQHWAHALHVPYWWLQCLVWRRDQPFILARWYHKILVWDLMKRPIITRTIEKWLNPVMGKSIVLYFRKKGVS